MKINTFLKTIILLVILCLSLIGSQCDTTNVQQGELYGRWHLIYNSGDNKDICPGETINFQQNGVAYLKCPDRDSVQAAFSVSGNTLTYTNTNVRYEIVNLTNELLELNGLNINRYLYYTKNYPADIPEGTGNKISSER